MSRSFSFQDRSASEPFERLEMLLVAGVNRAKMRAANIRRERKAARLHLERMRILRGESSEPLAMEGEPPEFIQ
jgi:hypothetical protein